jgi:hypothetical protein
MVSRYVGSGRPQEGGFLAVHKQDFEAHRTGGDWRHEAGNIDMNPVLTTAPGPNVQAAITNLGASFVQKIVTVGDGTNSFGDFNGPDAIQQAINFGAGNPIIIFAKFGQYVITNITPIATGTNQNITIIGASGNGTDPTHYTVIRDDRSDLINGAINVNGAVFIQRVCFTKGSGLGIALRFASTAIQQPTIIDNCYFNNCYTEVEKTGGKISFTNCKFDNSAPLTENTFTAITPSYSGFADGISFENCRFDLGYGSTAACINSDNITYGTPDPFVLEYLRFNSCRFIVESLTSEPQNDGYTISIINIRNTFSAATGTFYINEIAITNSDVYSLLNHVYSGALYLPVDPGIILEKLIISGGRWMIEAYGSSPTGPFFVGSSSAIDDSSNIRKVIIENLQFGWGDIALKTYGSQDSSYGYRPTELTAAWNWSDGYWGAMTIAAKEIVIRDLWFRGTTKLGTHQAEITLSPTYSLFVDGVYMTDYTFSLTGPSGLPNGRFIVFEPLITSPVISPVYVKNVIVDFNGLDTVNVAGTIIISKSKNIAGTSIDVVFDSCKVLNTMAAAGNSGATGFYVGPTSDCVGNYKFINCASIRNNEGLLIQSNGTPPLVVGKVSIIGGDYNDNYSYGITASCSNYTFTNDSILEIIGANILRNNISGADPGALIHIGAYSGRCGTRIINNNIYDNSSIVTENQLSIGLDADIDLIATIIGNNCAGAGAGAGKIVLHINAGTYYVAGGNANGVVWQFGGAAPPSGTNMDLNVAVLTFV